MTSSSKNNKFNIFKKIKQYLLLLIIKHKINKINNEAKIFNKNNRTINIIKQNHKQNIILNKKYTYTIQPHEFYIQNNIDSILDLSKTFFLNKNYIVYIGIEIEFYLPHIITKTEELYNKIYNFSTKQNINIYDIERERGQNQFEIKFKPYSDVNKLINDFNNIKQFLINEFNAIFNDMPFKNDSGSALQINISIADKTTNKNLFSRNKDKTQESKLLLNSVAGLLQTTNLFLPFYLSKNKNTTRLEELTNKILYSNGKIPAPTYISWGINNRTCAIRIPIPKNIYNEDNYFTDDDKNRRIEFRVPSADSDIKYLIYCILNSIAFGITNNLIPIDSTYNNVLLNHENYEKIELKKYLFEEYYRVLKVLFNF
ncbi:MAG: hypothetical protein J6C50_02725 [Rickettsiales bacterium]|nr:hypothetical protein [Rickettsiales bacterium]